MKEGNAASTLLARQAATVGDRLITIREVAQLLGLCTRQIQKLVASGRFIPPLRISRSIRWRASLVNKFLECDGDMNRYNAETKNGAA